MWNYFLRFFSNLLLLKLSMCADEKTVINKKKDRSFLFQNITRRKTQKSASLYINIRVSLSFLCMMYILSLCVRVRTFFFFSRFSFLLLYINILKYTYLKKCNLFPIFTSQMRMSNGKCLISFQIMDEKLDKQYYDVHFELHGNKYEPIKNIGNIDFYSIQKNDSFVLL